ncbi:hypothetical protein [Glaesserella parasuis]|uniref:hypothetical protein n=1 Tax=Glaesserella parasuis TaxID=738 RepID=UPI00243653D2|nr:hypothetical protein [Glaesserella parasuis]MDG6293721.1 hypothetical protein [Glaesserella parasuis]MDO9677078.1 hypothetical protein [Glaesserella parasuis]MDO9692955.1 hypothetical protein [Glaesserella parasuis]MDO9761573.1 hypothetical protein [Glaesserella parasuis]MDO9794750.1 hypothetical protein [Glaesserella parasuis]
MKKQLNTKEEFGIAVQQFIDEFFEQNPIYKELKLNEEQMEILSTRLIMPKFQEQFEFDKKLMHKWGRG